MKKSIAEILKHLQSQGLRLTQPRKELVSFILLKEGHWTILSLVEETKKHLPRVGVATIYRTVALLQKYGLLIETHMRGSAARYEVSTPHHHDHLTCRLCGKIFEFENSRIEKLQMQIAKELGFKLIDHRMELYGECQRPHCCSKTCKKPKSKS